MTRLLPAALITLTLLSSACGAKRIQSQLDSCSAEMNACQKALEEARKSAMDTSFVDERFASYRDLARQFRDAFGDDGIDIVVRDGRMVVQLPNAVLFESGKAMLSDSGKTALDKAAPILSKNTDRRFLIAGHTDSAAVKDGARFKNNWELSVLRATAAVTYLESKGVPPTQIGAAGYGPHLPTMKNDSDEGKAANRRLEIVVFPTLKERPSFPDAL